MSITGIVIRPAVAESRDIVPKGKLNQHRAVGNQIFRCITHLAQFGMVFTISSIAAHVTLTSLPPPKKEMERFLSIFRQHPGANTIDDRLTHDCRFCLVDAVGLHKSASF